MHNHRRCFFGTFYSFIFSNGRETPEMEFMWTMERYSLTAYITH